MAACHGWDVDSHNSFVYLREGTGDRLIVREHDYDHGPTRHGRELAEIRRRNETLTRVYVDGRRYQVWMEGIGWFLVDAGERSISIPRFENAAWLESVLWGLPTSLLLLDQGSMIFHASAVEIDGGAYLFAAPGGHGKTTLAGALMSRGHRLLTEDLIRCYVDEDRLAFPGPALIRLRRDVAQWMTIPRTTVVTEDSEKVHYGVDLDLRGRADPIPFRGLIFLHRGDHTRLERAKGPEILSDLWAVMLNLPTPEGRARCFQQINDVAAKVPVWRLTRPLRSGELRSVVELVEETVSA